MKITKEKVKKIIFPSREGLESKWWHRFIKVLIYISVVLVLFIGLFVSVSKYNNKEITGSYLIPHTNLTFEQIKKLDTASGSKSTVRLEDGSYIINGEPASAYTLIDYIREKNQENKQEQQKESQQQLITDIFITILVTIIWFILIESIIYRTFLYIIYGNKQ